MSICEKKRPVSSTNKIGFSIFEAWCKSFKYNRDNKRPKMDPWGTPHVTVAFLEELCSKKINCFSNSFQTILGYSQGFATESVLVLWVRIWCCRMKKNMIINNSPALIWCIFCALYTLMPMLIYNAYNGLYCNAKVILMHYSTDWFWNDYCSSLLM